MNAKIIKIIHDDLDQHLDEAAIKTIQKLMNRGDESAFQIVKANVQLMNLPHIPLYPTKLQCCMVIGRPSSIAKIKELHNNQCSKRRRQKIQRDMELHESVWTDSLRHRHPALDALKDWAIVISRRTRRKDIIPSSN